MHIQIPKYSHVAMFACFGFQGLTEMLCSSSLMYMDQAKT